jgi:glyceraldehyde-3-phosphate dehydrogenase/erythrose-4-phosphate dehydrogenase
MSTRVAINGLGRIGRAILKLVMDEPSLELVAVNDLVEVENLAYLLRFDTVYGHYPKSVAIDGKYHAIRSSRWTSSATRAHRSSISSSPRSSTAIWSRS